MARSLTCLILVLGALASLLGRGAFALDEPRAENLVTATLIAEVESVRAGESFWVAIHMEMADGWHVSWQNPGDAGLAPAIDWTLPSGFTVGNIQWPYPDRFLLPELAIFGYAGDAFLLAEVHPPAVIEESAITLEAKIEWLACREACIPGSGELRLSLPVTATPPVADARWAAAFRKTRERIPVSVTKWRFGAKLKGHHVELRAVPPVGFTNRLSEVYFFPSKPGVIEPVAQQRLRRNAGNYFLVMERAKMSVDVPKRLRGIVVSDRAWGDGTRKAVRIDIPLD